MKTVRSGHLAAAQGQAVFSVNSRMCADVMSAFHLIGVECLAGLRPLTIRGESARPRSLAVVNASA
jgi:hypothetical protein